MKVYRIVEKDKKDECYLFVGETPNQPGNFVASVLFWKRTIKSSSLSLKIFTSLRNINVAKTEAENWIKNNLFINYNITILKNK